MKAKTHVCAFSLCNREPRRLLEFPETLEWSQAPQPSTAVEHVRMPRANLCLAFSNRPTGGTAQAHSLHLTTTDAIEHASQHHDGSTVLERADSGSMLVLQHVCDCNFSQRWA